MKVYIGTSSSYEHSNNIMAFATEAQAQAWIKACNEYDANPKRPRYPDDIDDITDEVFEKYYTKIKRWQKKHPAGDGAYDEWYGYQEMEVIKP